MPLQTHDLPVWSMRPLVRDADGKVLFNPADWPVRKAEIRRRFLATLGAVPASQKLRGCRTLETFDDQGITCHRLAIELDDEDVMQAWLLVPIDPPVRREVAVAFVPTNMDYPGKDLVAGRCEVRRPQDSAYGLELARRGWTVVVPDHFAVPDRYAHGLKAWDTARFYERFPAWSAVGKMIFDGRALLDVLETLPQTAGRPVSIMGHSLGGQYAIYLAAVDDRPVSVGINCGIFPFADAAQRDHLFRDHWYIYFKHEALKRSVRQGPEPLWDYHELAAAIAPRRLWMHSAPNDPLISSYTGLVAMTGELLALYDHLDADGRCTSILDNNGHAFNPCIRQALYAWMEEPAA